MPKNKKGEIYDFTKFTSWIICLIEEFQYFNGLYNRASKFV